MDILNWFKWSRATKKVPVEEMRGDLFTSLMYNANGGT